MAAFSLLLHLLLALSYLSPLFSSSSTIPTNQSTFFALMKQSLVGPATSQWNSTVTGPNPTVHCNYAGVTCDPRGDVVTIDLSGWSLTGRFPADVCSYLPRLRVLLLDHNDLHGGFPPGLLNCSSLEELGLSSSGLTGVIPDLSPLQSLRFLDVSGNFFTGDFPTSITNISSLEVANFNENPGFRTWRMPEAFTRLTRLTDLILSTSSMRGEVPEWIGNMTSLVDLELCGNYLVGRIPTSIGRLHNLRHLELYYNLLSGPIPDELGNLTGLLDIDLSVNHLTGSIPATICSLPALRVLQLYNNSLTGEIHPSLGNSTSLTILSVYQNFLSGEVPPAIGTSSEMVVLELSENRLSGPLPRHACAAGKLKYLLVLDNLFSGELPGEYASCSPLLRFRVGYNRLGGVVPPGLFGLRHVSIIDLSFNGFQGPIPSTIGKAENLSALFLQNNQFSGVIPKEISYATNLVKIDLGSNVLSGPIPSEMGNLKKLNLLSLQGNMLVSSIPESLSSLTALNVLNLSHNLLSGEIPENLCDLLPNSLDFSNNRLSGPIPLPLLREGLTESFSGNPGLCVPYRLNSSTVPILPLCPRPDIRKRLGNICWAVVVSGVLLVLGALLFIRRWVNNRRDVVEHDGLFTPPSYSYDITSFHKVSFDQNEIVKALVDKNIVGHGGSGTVYKISLSNGECVAVKKIWTRNKASKDPSSDRFYMDRELKSEVDTLGSIRHKNIVKLYCCFSSSNSNLLVYEYMSNGNLWDALHGGWSFFLNWPTRYRVALGIAQGLAYLHHDLVLPIVHRDIKTSNILLDADCEPKVADFGIAKVLQARREDSSTTIIAGTYGYLAPEYAYSSKATTKCDVYSFGVVLMELVTGRKPSEAEFGENKDIVYWVSSKFSAKGGAAEVLDNRLSKAAFKDEMVQVLRIAVRCTCNMPALRPSMNEVVQLLLEADHCKLDTCRFQSIKPKGPPPTSDAKNPTQL